MGSFTAIYHPPSPSTSPCTSGEIDSYYSDCFGPTATGTSCNTQFSAPTACKTCLTTVASISATSGNWGALLSPATGAVYYILDTGACIAGEYDADGGNTTALGCSAAWEAELECENLACGPSCASNSSNYNSCVNAADTGTCATYVTGRQNSCSMYTTDSRCQVTSNPPSEFQFDQVVSVFCGSGVSAEDTPMIRLMDRQ